MKLRLIQIEMQGMGGNVYLVGTYNIDTCPIYQGHFAPAKYVYNVPIY